MTTVYKLPTAKPTYRIIAGLIDFAIGLTIFLWLILKVAQSTSINDLLDQSLWLLAIMLVALPLSWGLLQLFMISKFGGTIGKLLTGIEIVDSKNERVSFWRAFFRTYIGYTISGSFFWLGFIWILVSKDHRGWHDLISDTKVIVKNSSGIIIGIMALILLTALAVWMTTQSAQLFVSHQLLYQKLFPL